MNLRAHLLLASDRLLAAWLVALLTGSALAFGGAVWWARPALAALTALFILTWLVRAALEGTWRIHKSPLVPLGLLALGLAVAQLMPLPGRLAGQLSPRSRAVHTAGVLPGLAAADAPEIAPPEPIGGPSPVTVDRPATLRWAAGATACLAVFWAVAQYADRLGRLYVVWGSIVAAFGLNTTLALVQLAGGAEGLYGSIEPGGPAAWAPSRDDQWRAPGRVALRPAPSSEANAAAAVSRPWVAPRPERVAQLGTQMGGPGAYLALGALGLPLGLALLLQVLSPRGSREGLAARLGHANLGGLVALLGGLTLVGAGLVGVLAGPGLAAPFALGLILAGLPAARPTGLGRTAVILTGLALVALAAGVLIGEALGRPRGVSPITEPGHWPEAVRTWADAARIARDFPLLGAGLGSFATVFPYYKTQDLAPTTAQSSLLQWAVEAGAAGLVLLGAALLWCLWRLPGAVRRVGTADRALAFGLVGAGAGFAALSAVHWTVELAAVALAASAVAGTAERWLAGGTDLFVGRS